ncbi:MAG TPA: ABC transporter substrate-binding protein [Candidatus Binatia bacterium]|nr:ABC transporter substrate-binding protein [Candidatus Binatia bacterium]
MNFAILRRPRTQAILDGIVKLRGLSARWIPLSDPLGWALPPAEKHRDLTSGDLDGGEMSIAAFVQAKSRRAPLVALPLFLKRGLVQRSLFCGVDSSLSSPEQLVGKRVGLVGYTSSMAVWMRGVLMDGYGVDFSSVQWFSVSGSSQHTQSLNIPAEFSPEKIQAWEELDGYPHELDRRETFLLSLLNRGALDAVVSFQARIDCERTRPLLPEDQLWSHPLNLRIYPINHLFVVKTEVLQEFPTITDSLLSAFREARRSWTAYQPEGEQKGFEREMAQLGYDPFGYRLGEVEKTTVGTFVGYLEREKLIPRKLGLDGLFYGGF